MCFRWQRACLLCGRPWVWCHTLHKLEVAWHPPAIPERSEVQGHLQLQREFKASLGYLRSYLQTEWMRSMRGREGGKEREPDSAGDTEERQPVCVRTLSLFVTPILTCPVSHDDILPFRRHFLFKTGTGTTPLFSTATPGYTMASGSVYSPPTRPLPRNTLSRSAFKFKKSSKYCSWRCTALCAVGVSVLLAILLSYFIGKSAAQPRLPVSLCILVVCCLVQFPWSGVYDEV